MRAQGVSASAKLLLIALSEIINAKGEFCWPRQELLAERVMKNERTIRRLTRELESVGLIRYQPGRGLGRGRGRTEGRFFLAVDPETGAPRTLPEVTTGQKCPPVKRDTAGHQRPPVSITAGHACPPVSVTTGQKVPLQADTSVRSGTGREPKPYTGNGSEKEKVVAAEATTPELFGPLDDAPKPEKRRGLMKPGDGSKALEAYNAAASECGWVQAKIQPNDPRKRAIQARLNEVGLDGWMEQISIARQQPFLGGKNDKLWRLDLEFFCKPSGWAKIAEGKYGRGEKVGQPKRASHGYTIPPLQGAG